MSDEVEDGRTGEKSSLVQEDVDAELYSSTTCWKARSFKLAVLVSIIALVSVGLVVVGVATGLAVSSSRKSSNQQPDRVITLDDVFDPNFAVKTFQGTWAGSLVIYLQAGDVVEHDPASNSNSTLIDNSEIESIGPLSVVVPSPQYSSGAEGAKRLLLSFNRTGVYRHSTLSEYYIAMPSNQAYDIEPLQKPSGLENSRFQYAAWSPDSQYIAYVMDYNIYMLELSTGTLTAITSGGSERGVIYGIPDWVYEEEVYASDHALWWSPDSRKILFASFDDSLVETYSFPKYGNPDQQYDTIETIPYPKPGTTNPTVNLYVVAVNDTSSNISLSPGSLFENEHYLAYAGWAESTRPFAAWLNRTQTFIEFCTYTDGSSDCSQIYSYEVPGGWVEQYSSSALHLVRDTTGIVLYTLLSRDMQGDSYTHLASVRNANVEFLTGPGQWVVQDIIGVHGNEIFYLSAETGVWKQHLYSYNTEAGTSVCLSCDQQGWGIPSSPNPALPESCDYFLASCDQQLQYCLVHCRGPRVPYSIMTRYDGTGRSLVPVSLLEPNTVLSESVADVTLPTTTSFTVPSSSEGPELVGKLTLPPGFDDSKRYPVLVYVYGGPNFQVVSDSCILNSLSNLFYVSNLSLILASVDGRGTGGRGNQYKFSVYQNLGHYETIDQIRAGRFLSDLGYVEGSKLAIYGSSYGGYMAGNVGSSGSGVFKAAISQSPVSDWHYYDSIYTERYMLKPSDNLDGYQSTSILPKASKLQEVDYMLIHGTGDDNVHYQHTAQLAEALTQADVQFRMQVYTDKAHSLTGGNTRRHLYQLIADFLSESFKT